MSLLEKIGGIFQSDTVQAGIERFKESAAQKIPDALAAAAADAVHKPVGTAANPATIAQPLQAINASGQPVYVQTATTQGQAIPTWAIAAGVGVIGLGLVLLLKG